MEDFDNLKSKISSKLDNLNKNSLIFDEMIREYNILYKNYNEIKLRKESSSTVGKEEQSKLKTLQEEFDKLQKRNQEYAEKTNEYISQIYELKKQLDTKEKKLTGYFTENGALKQQNFTLTKNNKELNEINQRNAKIINVLEKRNQKYEIDHKKLIDVNGKMLMQNDNLKKKLLRLQSFSFSSRNLSGSLIKLPKKQDSFKSITRLDENQISYLDEQTIQKNLKYKLKIHSDDINYINFNKSGSSYLTVGKDCVINVYDSLLNNDTNTFSDFKKTIIGACYDHKEELVFAGSHERTAKLWSLKENKLLNTFSGHNNDINCIKSFNCNEYGITGSSDNTIRQWDFNTKYLMKKLKYNNECHSLDIEPYDNYILSGHKDGSVLLWGNNDTFDNSFKVYNDATVTDIKILNDNLFLTSGSNKTIKLFDIKKGQAIYTIDESIIPDIKESSITICPDKQSFAVGNGSGFIYIVNINDGKIKGKFNNGNGAITALNWRPNTSQIYVGDSNGFISIWE